MINICINMNDINRGHHPGMSNMSITSNNVHNMPPIPVSSTNLTNRPYNRNIFKKKRSKKREK